MSEAMNQALAIKQARRKERAALSFEEKIALVEKMRNHSLEMAAHPLRLAVSAKGKNRNT